MVQTKWFKWEREAVIHLLYPTLEGSMTYLKNYVGFSFPTNILIFKNGVVTWCLDEENFYEVGAKLRRIYKNPKKEKQSVEDLKKSLKELQRVEKAIEKTDLKAISNQKLLDLYSNLRQTFLVSYAIGAISTPLSLETERFLKEHSHLTDKQLNALTKPKKDSYIKLAEKYLLKTGDIDGFIKKYYWINNNYAGTFLISKKEVLQKLDILKSAALKRKVRRRFAVELSKENDRLIELLRNYVVYKDERKKNILIYLHYLEILLKEVAKRAKLTLDDLRNIFPWEVQTVLSGNLSSSEIQQRKKYCVVVWKEGQNQSKLLMGQEAKKLEDKILNQDKTEEKIVKGNTASIGKVKGRVRVLLSAKECNSLKQGEILVTFMTSPDFMKAIRKAGAIVTNLGGVTSHAAIISRELGIPCIVGTKNATEVLKTGDLVEVDADLGVVRILK